mmetsp:Transcript_27455/g.50638  ORF Transcript_27455/g.50638 Transcript_27455/m.50638 type:complete len:423 (+) Transcript_27455:458-1726(+)
MDDAKQLNLSEAATPRRGSSAVTAVIVTLVFALFIGITYGFGFDLFSLVIPDMQTDLGFDYTDAGVLSAATRFGFLLGGLVASFTIQWFGHGRMIIGSVGISSICILGMGFVETSALVGILLLILGICAATVYVPMVVVVGQVIAHRHRAKSFGIISSGQSYMVFINGMIAPYFLLNYDWRVLWQFVGVLSLLIFVGSFIYLYAIGVIERRGQTLQSAPDKASADAHLNPVGIRTITFQTCLVWTLIFFSGFLTQPYQTYISPFLRDELGVSLEITGWVWSALGFVGIWSGFVMGFIADRIGTRWALLMCYAFLCSGCAMLFFHLNNASFIGAGIVYGMAFYPIYGLIPAYITKTYEPQRAVFVFGIANVFLGLGGTLGNFLGGVAKTHFGTFEYNYAAGAVLCVCLGLVVLLLQRETSDDS